MLSRLTPGDLQGVARARWFQGKAAALRDGRIIATARAPGSASALAVLELTGDDGSRARYVAPVAEAGLDGPSDDLWRALARCCAEASDVEGDGCRIVARYRSTLEATVAADATIRPAGSDQTHTSLVVGERFLLKCYRRLAAHTAREPELLARLTEAGETAVPALFAAADIELPDGRAALLLLQHYVPDAVDGWAHAERELAGAVEPSDWPAGMGTVLARVHHALMRSEPAAGRAALPAELAAWATRADAHVASAVERAAGADRALLEAARAALKADWDAAADEPRPLVAPIHGDVHLGQFLLHPGGLPHLVDFELAPGLEAPAAPGVDLASLLRSVTNVRNSMAGDAAPGWTGTVRTAMARAYEDELCRLGRTAVAGPAALRAFELSQAVHEWLYAATMLPSWTPTARAGLRGLLDER